MYASIINQAPNELPNGFPNERIISMSTNMRIWSVLGKTDPAHTKTFKRAGGFSGTAVKPMWANKQMTELFGPCGIGWGQTEPQYQVVEAAGEVLVYCTA